MIRSTYTYITMEVSSAAYEEIRKKLLDAGYNDAVHDGDDVKEVLDMRGIALVEEK